MRDAWLIAAKDLRLEMRSRVALTQVLPYVFTVVLLFGFAFNADSPTLQRVTPGLFWVTMLFASMLTVQRAFSVESADGVRDALRLSGLDGSGIFLGKAAAILAQLAVIEVVLGVSVTVFYGRELRGIGVLFVTAVVASIAIAATGTLFGVMAAGLDLRETLLPLLFFPAIAPVLIAATQASDLALSGDSATGWKWTALLSLFAAVYTAFGALAFGPLLEDS